MRRRVFLVLAAVALAACRSSGERPQARPVARASPPMCPLEIAGTAVRIEHQEGGAAVLFENGDASRQPLLRDAVERMAERHNRQRRALTHRHPVGAPEIGAYAGDDPGPAAAWSDPDAERALELAHAWARETPSGARLDLRVDAETDTDVASLRRAVAARLAAMDAGSCPELFAVGRRDDPAQQRGAPLPPPSGSELPGSEVPPIPPRP